MIHVPSLIERKRDGGELTELELDEFIRGYTDGSIPDYQASAFAMAVYFRGMSDLETGHLTQAMMRSGRMMTHRPGSPPKVDKHSTGGIGDKVTLVLAPLLACDDLWIPTIAGRGLGITGGTLDKMESIPGFSFALNEAEVEAQLERLGVAMLGQTDDLCPADKKLYALRDVTGCVQSQPLIVASIMSKKLVESLDRLVLDVKFGSGALMQTRPQAELLAAALVAVGEEMGVQTTYLLTPMDEPLGHTAGNALEVAESVATLQGGGPPDLVSLTLDLAEQVSTVSRVQLAKWLEDGTAWRKFVALVEAQQGDATVLEKITKVHRAPIIHALPAAASGRILKMDAGAIGRACVALGAGRAKSTDPIDFAVGCSGIRKAGEQIEKGEPVLYLHARSESQLATALGLLNGNVGTIR
ncbi:MAG: thymidine phosphorylase [Chthoniobacteraceae bacterium]|nr:thymidine phosphorylase [Chthoniobacteraceae bacterium]